MWSSLWCRDRSLFVHLIAQCSGASGEGLSGDLIMSFHGSLPKVTRIPGKISLWYYRRARKERPESELTGMHLGIVWYLDKRWEISVRPLFKTSPLWLAPRINNSTATIQFRKIKTRSFNSGRDCAALLAQLQTEWRRFYKVIKARHLYNSRYNSSATTEVLAIDFPRSYIRKLYCFPVRRIERRIFEIY